MIRFFSLFGIVLLHCSPAMALYLRPDLENIPVERLVKNLKNLAEKEPKNVNHLLNLGRAHAMAWSQKVDEISIQKNQETRGPWFGFEPKFVPFTAVKKTEDKKKLAAAAKHLEEAIAWYEKALKLDEKLLTTRLGLAWLTEQKGKKAEAIKMYRSIITEAWDNKEKNLRAVGLGGHTYTAETAGYLIPLLDPSKDAQEIKELENRISYLKSLPRPITPIALPLEDALCLNDLIDPQARVSFDLEGMGARTYTWITPRAAWLVWDSKQTGKITSGLQLFGNVTFWMPWENGFQALSSLDDNQDGLLNGQELNGLSLWHDRNSNGVAEPGETKTVAAHGIISLSCRYKKLKSGELVSSDGVLYKNGRRRSAFDLILKSQ